MAELISLCGRGGTVDTYTAADLETVADRILPENAPRDVEVVRDDGVLTCRINAPESLPTQATSTCLGQMIPRTDDWHEPGAPVRDGTYGIVRVDSDAIELVADATASRTVYYRRFDDLFVASTSQRAIAHFADEFVLDEAAVAWMISSGTLGPSQAWDPRTEHVPPEGVVRLDRSTWEVTETTRDVTFDPTDEPDSVHRDRLVESLDDTFDALEVNTATWQLPLSGGLDSRELLLRLKDHDDLRAFTWGTEAALDDPESDAVLARELADACDVPHRYYTLPETPEDVGEVFDRFITAGEGRIDHVSGYIDGFSVFENLANSNVDGLIRGDEGFGWRPVGSPAAVREAIGAPRINDYETLPNLSIPGQDTQAFPERLEQKSGQSLATWRDRLYHTYRIPVVLGALTSLKTPYVEVVNPFLTRQVLETVRGFPDDRRTDKQLYAEYVRERSPDVPVATRSANPDTERLLGSDASIEFLRNQLDTDQARSVLDDELIDHALNELGDSGETTENESGSVIDTIKREVGAQLPQSVIQRIEAYTPVSRPKITISGTQLGFRLYIIQSMCDQLRSDSDLF